MLAFHVAVCGRLDGSDRLANRLKWSSGRVARLLLEASVTKPNQCVSLLSGKYHWL